MPAPEQPFLIELVPQESSRPEPKRPRRRKLSNKTLAGVAALGLGLGAAGAYSLTGHQDSAIRLPWVQESLVSTESGPPRPAFEQFNDSIEMDVDRATKWINTHKGDRRLTMPDERHLVWTDKNYELKIDLPTYSAETPPLTPENVLSLDVTLYNGSGNIEKGVRIHRSPPEDGWSGTLMEGPAMAGRGFNTHHDMSPLISPTSALGVDALKGHLDQLLQPR